MGNLTFGHEIKRLREYHGMSASILAERIGRKEETRRQFIYDIEKGKGGINRPLLENFAECFGVSLTHFLPFLTEEEKQKLSLVNEPMPAYLKKKNRNTENNNSMSSIIELSNEIIDMIEQANFLLREVEKKQTTILTMFKMQDKQKQTNEYSLNKTIQNRQYLMYLYIAFYMVVWIPVIPTK